MNHKELIELSKKAAAEWEGTHEYYQAATLITSLCSAIETLLAERDALKNAKLDRSLWKGCQYCEADSEGYSTVFKDDTGRSRRLYIPEGEAAIVVPGKYNHKAYIKIGYCPFCGKPLTEEAWAELGRRINGGKTD